PTFTVDLLDQQQTLTGDHPGEISRSLSIGQELRVSLPDVRPPSSAYETGETFQFLFHDPHVAIQVLDRLPDLKRVLDPDRCSHVSEDGKADFPGGDDGAVIVGSVLQN